MRGDASLPTVEEVLRPFARLPVDFAHPQNVARLAVSLYDQMERCHRMGAAERRVLWCAALLHDVGYAEGWRAHHKHSYRLIRETPTPCLAPRENLLVACVARYHRGADPKARHEGYAELSEDERLVVHCLAAILRTADGLDRGQVGRVTRVAFVREGAGAAELRVYAPYRPELELAAGRKKAALLEEVYGIRLTIRYAGACEITS